VLWLNDGQGRFRDVGLEWGVAYNSIGEAAGSMNATIGDVDGNGFMDLFVTRLGYGSLYLQQPDGFYEDRMWASGLGALTERYVGWGGCFIDVDNDGDLDLFIANGSAFDLEPGSLPLLLKNDGQAQFSDGAAEGGSFFRASVAGSWGGGIGFQQRWAVGFAGDDAGRACGVAGEPRCQDHITGSNCRWREPAATVMGMAPTCHLRAGDRTWHMQAVCPTGFLLQGDKRIHVGLGAVSRVDEIRIRWPSGTVQVLRDVDVDQILRVREPVGKRWCEPMDWGWRKEERRYEDDWRMLE
jgi:enediyne biosynthesis protein E4